MATEKELKSIYDMFTDTWRFYRKHADMQQTEEYWEAMLAEAREITERHQDNKLCCDLIIAVMAELERKNKRFA